MTKKSNTSSDLDFGEMTVPKKKQPKKKKGKDLVLNIPLSIPITGSSNTFISRTIFQCSAKEFSYWSQKIAYPIKSQVGFYASPENRLNHFLKALSYHKRNFILANPNTYKTVN